MKREIYDEDHEAFRSSVKEFLDREVVPDLDKHAEEKALPREFWVEVAEPHHVLRLTLTGGRDTGELDLSAFDEDVEVEAPPASEVVEFTG